MGLCSLGRSSGFLIRMVGCREVPPSSLHFEAARPAITLRIDQGCAGQRRTSQTTGHWGFRQGVLGPARSFKKRIWARSGMGVRSEAQSKDPKPAVSLRRQRAGAKALRGRGSCFLLRVGLRPLPWSLPHHAVSSLPPGFLRGPRTAPSLLRTAGQG